MTYLVLFTLTLLGAFALFGARALRSEHLLALRWRTGGLFLFERGSDGRYTILPPARVPAAVARFAGMELAGALHLLPERVARRPRAAHA